MRTPSPCRFVIALGPSAYIMYLMKTTTKAKTGRLVRKMKKGEQDRWVEAMMRQAEMYHRLKK